METIAQDSLSDILSIKLFINMKMINNSNFSRILQLLRLALIYIAYQRGVFFVPF